MKKTYIQPEAKAYKIVVNRMIMTSPTTVTIHSDEYNDKEMEDL